MTDPAMPRLKVPRLHHPRLQLGHIRKPRLHRPKLNRWQIDTGFNLNKQAFQRGFVKAAMASGVDPLTAVKLAQLAPVPALPPISLTSNVGSQLAKLPAPASLPHQIPYVNSTSGIRG